MRDGEQEILDGVHKYARSFDFAPETEDEVKDTDTSGWFLTDLVFIAKFEGESSRGNRATMSFIGILPQDMTEEKVLGLVRILDVRTHQRIFGHDMGT